MSRQASLIPNKNIQDTTVAGFGRLKRLVFTFIAVLILLTAVAFFAVCIDKPYMGVTLSLNTEGWSISNVDPNGAANQAGIKPGDIPLEINNHPAQVFLDKYHPTNEFYGLAVNQLSVTGQNGQIKSVNLEDSRPTAQSIAEISTILLTCIIFWVVGFYVLFKKPLSLAAWLLCYGSVFIGLTAGATLAANSSSTYAVPIAVIGLAISPFILLHFFIILPEERAQLRKNRWLYFIYLPALITLILYPFIGYAEGQLVPWFRSVRLDEFIVALLAVAGVAVFNYLHTASIKTRQQMKIVAFSTVAALIPFLLFSLLFPALWKETAAPYGFQVLFLSFIPIGMGYAVVTQRLLDIDLVIRRGVVYGAITIVMAIILAAGIFPTIALYKSIGTPGEIIITLILGVVATILFGPLKKSAELAVDRLFYKDRYDYRKIIQELSNSLNRLNDLNDISRLVVSLSANTLNLTGASLFIEPQPDSYDLRAAIGIFSESEKQTDQVKLIRKRNPLNEFPNSAAELDPELGFLIPLSAGDREIGILCLSQKATRQAFSNNDIYLLQGIASAAAAAIRSALLVRDVSLRNTFVSIASHELRTPLTSIVGFADLILHRNPPEDVKKTWTKYIFDNANKLAAMVDDLLNVTRIQSGKTRLKMEAVKLDSLLGEQMEITRQRSDRHNFVINIEPDLPYALVDRDKFGHVIGNLLNNAIKYSPNGGNVTLSARHDPDRGRIIITVSDEGIGISAADKESLFTTFHRIQRPETTGISGSGLGLYIAKEWTEAMGGDIWLESELNRGSTFFIGIQTRNSDGTPEKSKLQEQHL